MPQQMVLGPWHEIWEAFLYYVSSLAAEHDQVTHNNQLWPSWMQQTSQGSYKIRVGFAKQESRIVLVHGRWSENFEQNPSYEDTWGDV